MLGVLGCDDGGVRGGWDLQYTLHTLRIWMRLLVELYVLPGPRLGCGILKLYTPALVALETETSGAGLDLTHSDYILVVFSLVYIRDRASGVCCTYI